MPCRYDPTPEEEARWARQQREEAEQNFLHNSTLAEMFCKTMQELESLDSRLTLNFKIVDRLPAEAQKWWTDHKRRDFDRLVKDFKKFKTSAQRSAALKKLTPYEQKLIDEWVSEVNDIAAERAIEERSTEQKIAEVLEKLTPDERALLGFKRK